MRRWCRSNLIAFMEVMVGSTRVVGVNCVTAISISLTIKWWVRFQPEHTRVPGRGRLQHSTRVQAAFSYLGWCSLL